MTVDSRARDYRLFRPPALDYTKPIPLVIALHGFGDTADGFVSASLLDTEAATGGFLAVYPNGCGNDWNQTHASYDVHFISKLIDRLKTEFQIDKARVFIVGLSAGAMMAYRLACDLSSQVAAIASVAGTMWWEDCQPAGPISILEMHGTADAELPYQGGVLTGYKSANIPSTVALNQRWAMLDGCVGGPIVTQRGITKTSVWKQCNGRTIVRLDTIIGGHHTWFGSSEAGLNPVPGEPNANTAIWSFFSSLQPKG